MKRSKPNFRFLAVFFASVVILCTSTYFVHGYQVRRNAGALLLQAEQLQKAGKLQDAANYLGQYVGLLPKDADGLARYGLLLADPKLVKTGRDAMRAKMVLERALYFEPNRDDVRRGAIKIALEMGDSTGAREDIRRLRIKSPNDGELIGLLARSHELGGKYSDARTAYEESIKLAPTQVDNFVRLAALLRLRTSDVKTQKETVAEVHKRADEVTNAMVAANPKSHQAYLYRAEYLQQFLAASDKDAEKQAASDIAKARELSPDVPEVLMAAANLARQRGDIEEARKLLRRGCELHPDDFRLYLAAARLEELNNQPDAAIADLRQGLNKIPNNYDLLWQLADLLTREGKTKESLDTLGRLKNLGVPEANCDVLQARLLLKDQNWPDAAAMLEKAIGTLMGRRNLAVDPLATQLALQAGVALGRCYEQMGDFDRAFAAYNRVVARDPRSIAGNLGLAMTLNAMGRPTEALDRYRQLMLLPNAPGIGLVEIARLTFFRNLALEEVRRNWAEVNKAISNAEDLLTKPLPVQVVVLRADALAAQGQIDAARKHLMDRYPDAKDRPAEAWAGLAMLEARQDRLDVAIALLDEARQIHKDSVDLRLASARLMVRKSPKDVAAILPQLEAGSESWKPETRRQLRSGLADVAVQAGDFATASQLWKQLATDAPNDLRYQLVLFDLAAKNNDENGMQQSIDKMKKIEGKGGVMWRFATAAKLVGKAARGDKSGLSEARSLLLDVAKRRPNWSRADFCQAQLDDLEGKSDEALTGYQRQIARGEREPLLIRRAVEMLYQKRRYAEAYELFRLLPNPETLSHEVNRLGSAVALSTNNAEAALNLAKAAVANGSKDFRDHLWLGRVYLAANQKDQAGPAFEEARKLAPTEPETWVTLIQFLAATGAKDRALVELEAAKKQLSGPAGMIALANCLEALGQSEPAREAYKAAVTANPDDATTIRAIAEFYFRTGQMAEAAPHLRRLGMELKDKNPASATWARQTLALALALQGDPRNTGEALQLLAEEEKAAPRGSDLSNVERTRATILAMQGTKRSRQDAIQIFKKLFESGKAMPADHFLAAQLYDSLGQWPEARLRYVTLLEMPGGNTPAHKITYCRSLLRHNAVDLARPMISELEAQDSKAWPVQELQARLLHAQGKTAEAIKHLEAVAQDETRVPVVAGLLNELKAFDAAEAFFRRLAGKPNQPINSLALAQFLASRRKFAEAIDICDRVWSEVPVVAVAEIATGVLSELPPNSPEFGRVERRLMETMKAAPDNSDLIVAMANLRNFQGRYDDAEQLYRAALAKNPRQSTALNNLAWIIALRGGRPGEAIELITRAMDVVGPDSGLLDTRGIAYLALKQAQYNALALKDLENVASESPSASSYFHLAQAYVAAGRLDDAKEAWQKAKKEFQLSAGALHPLERPTYEKMAREFN